MKKITLWNKIIMFLICIGGLFYFFVAAADKNVYQALICLTVIPVTMLPILLRKFGKIKIPNILEGFYMIFIFFAYLLGSILKFYGKVDHFDTVIHFVSGILTSFLAVYIIISLNKGRKNNKWVTFLFILGFTALAAVSWEIFEFISDKISGKDAQHAMDTGVDDTMIDMIVL